MKPSREQLSIVSYNVRYFGHAFRGMGSSRGSRRKIASALVALSPAPELICLQEVETRSIRSRVGRPPRRAGETQLEAFMDAFADQAAAEGKPFPYEAFYFRAHVYSLLKTNLYTTGLAVLVDRDRLEVASHNCAEPERITHHHVARFKDRKQSRICAQLTVRTRGGATLHLFNTHLSLPTPFDRGFWRGEEKMGFGVNQLHEARKLIGFVQKHAGSEPFVLCGDFNSPPGSPVYQALVAELPCDGAQAVLGQIDPSRLRDFPTAGFLRLRMHLDHLFSGGGVRWVDLEGTHPFGAGPFHGLSDHVPLVGRFELPKA